MIVTKMAWATFWAIFSQTHPVTLNGNHADPCLHRPLRRDACKHVLTVLTFGRLLNAAFQERK
jgi:hypothetical protein